MKEPGDSHQDVPALSHPWAQAKEAQGHSCSATEGKQLPKAMAFFVYAEDEWLDRQPCTCLHGAARGAGSWRAAGCTGCAWLWPYAHPQRAPTLGSTSARSTHPNARAFPLRTTTPFERIQIFMQLVELRPTGLQHQGCLCSGALLSG